MKTHTHTHTYTWTHRHSYWRCLAASLGWRCPHLSDEDKEWEERRRRDRVIQMTEEVVVEEKRMALYVAYLLKPTPHPLCLCSPSLLLPLAPPCNPCHPWKTITFHGGPRWVSNLTHHTVTATSSSARNKLVPFHFCLRLGTYSTHCHNEMKQKRWWWEEREAERLRLWSEMDGFSFTHNAIVNICINTLEWKMT